jgi:hypothetical protein
MYPSRPGGPSRAMQPPQQIDPSLANQQGQGFYTYPPAGPFIQGLSSPSGSESVGTPFRHLVQPQAIFLGRRKQ